MNIVALPTNTQHSPQCLRYCPIDKQVYKKQILTKKKRLDANIRLTILQCNNPPYNVLDSHTCNLLWNEIEESSKYLSHMEEDLQLIEEEYDHTNNNNSSMSTDDKYNWIMVIRIFQMFRF